MEQNVASAAQVPPEDEKRQRITKQNAPQRPQVAVAPSGPSGPGDTLSQVGAMDAQHKKRQHPSIPSGAQGSDDQREESDTDPKWPDCREYPTNM